MLGQKSELSKAMEKMKEQMYKKQLEEEKVRNRSDLERELEKRARRLKEYEHALAEEGGLRYPPSMTSSTACMPRSTVALLPYQPDQKPCSACIYTKLLFFYCVYINSLSDISC